MRSKEFGVEMRHVKFPLAGRNWSSRPKYDAWRYRRPSRARVKLLEQADLPLDNRCRVVVRDEHTQIGRLSADENQPTVLEAPSSRAKTSFEPNHRGEGCRLLSRAPFKRPLYLTATLPQDGMPDLFTECHALSRCVVNHCCLSFWNAGNLSGHRWRVACRFCIAVLRLSGRQTTRTISLLAGLD